MPFDLNSSIIVILLVGFLAGLVFAIVLSTWITRVIVTAGVIGIVLLILVQGPSGWMDNIVKNFADYFHLWPFAPLGIILGVIIGTSIKKKS